VCVCVCVWCVCLCLCVCGVCVCVCVCVCVVCLWVCVCVCKNERSHFGIEHLALLLRMLKVRGSDFGVETAYPSRCLSWHF
jgi:hypothetical protein